MTVGAIDGSSGSHPNGPEAQLQRAPTIALVVCDREAPRPEIRVG